MMKLLYISKDCCAGGRLLEQASRTVWVLSLVCVLCVFGLFGGNYSTQNAGYRSFTARLLSATRRQMGYPGRKNAFGGSNDTDRMGKPVFGKDFLIFYNAIPKTGSRSLDDAIIHNNIRKKEEGNSLNFQLIPPPAFTDSKLLNEFARSRSIPSFIRGHAMYDEFISGPKVVYINAVRDPVDRVISNYYFDVFGDNASTATHGDDNWPETIDECIQTPTDKCNDAVVYYQALTLKQFCGMEERCKTVSRWTLERAKLNARRYTVVGLTSDMESTLRAIGILIPDLLGDIYREYVKHQNGSKTSTKTSQKHKPRPQTLRILRRRMQLQYEFYDYLSARFQRLKQDLHIP